MVAVSSSTFEAQECLYGYCAPEMETGRCVKGMIFAASAYEVDGVVGIGKYVKGGCRWPRPLD